MMFFCRYFSRRYLGEVSLDARRHPGQACFSVLDFWGNREVRSGSITAKE